MFMYYLLALAMGFMVILNPILNGKLSERVGTVNASFVNYTTATIASLFAVMVFQTKMPSVQILMTTPVHYYLGGLLGIGVILALNRIVVKLPAVLIVVLPFVGQMMVSTVIDFVALGQFSYSKVIGATLMLAGLIVNSLLDRKKASINTGSAN